MEINAAVCVCGCAGTHLDGTSDSDSDTEDQIDFKINDWLIFQMDRNVSEQQLFHSTGVRTTDSSTLYSSVVLWKRFWTLFYMNAFNPLFVLIFHVFILSPVCSAGL